MNSIDFAEATHVDAWFWHPVLGDPSFDSFQRGASNPVCVGQPPLEWPVNGFLFEDPVSGKWYLYVGTYMRGYWTRDEKSEPSRCVLYRSTDRGRTWEKLGAIWPDDLTMFDSDGKRPGHLPDVSVVYAQGRYHLTYDWARLDHTDGGIAYACADKPEGPFVRARQPIHARKGQPFHVGKYQRIYAQTIIRRRNDWLILAMMDGSQFHSWALVAITADKPEGPYSEPIFVRCVDHDTYHPPLMEFYPAFTHEGFVYAPCTSVALNRNFQMLFRAPVEQATQPEAWEIVQEGSLWHSEPVPHEHDGIWGQTFSGLVDAQGTLQAMYPSRTKEGLGTINLASRPWNKPLHERGFHFSGHRGKSLTFLRHRFGAFQLDATLRAHGTGRIFWGYRPRIGPDQPKSDSTLHPCCVGPHHGLELDALSWRMVSVNEQGVQTIRATGTFAPRDTRLVQIKHGDHGETGIRIDGHEVWSGISATQSGAIGLLAGAHGHLNIGRFRVTGIAQPLTISYLYTEGLVGAGVNMADWTEINDPVFRFGFGAVHNGPGGRVKWNFQGKAFNLWAPRGPAGGKTEVLLDGERIAMLDLHSATKESSIPVVSRTHLPPVRHAVVVRALEGRLVVDSLDVEVQEMSRE